MDNASFHKNIKTRELIESKGCSLLYIPPYSPDFNPIEKIWGSMKKMYRNHKHKYKDVYELIDRLLCNGWKTTIQRYAIALILYENGNGFRRIAEILSKVFGKKIYYQTVVKWLKKFHSDIKQNQATEPKEYCDIVELDELFTYLKKSQEKIKKQENMINPIPEYGLLLIGTKTICVHIGLEKEQRQMQSN